MSTNPPEPSPAPASPAPIEILPSILSADFGRLAEDVRAVLAAGERAVQVDVMDGHFVPNITVGPLVVEALKRSTDAFLDVHLMIDRPERYLADFARAGADLLTVHVEATTHLHRAIEQIHGLGARAGVALNPATPLSAIEEILPYLDLVLIMTVNPGFGGQAFIPTMLPKIARLAERIAREGHRAVIQVDGGIDPGTAPGAVAAGARQLVAGSAVFAAGLPIAEAIRRLRAAAEAGLGG